MTSQMLSASVYCCNVRWTSRRLSSGDSRTASSGSEYRLGRARRAARKRSAYGMLFSNSALHQRNLGGDLHLLVERQHGRVGLRTHVHRKVQNLLPKDADLKLEGRE